MCSHICFSQYFINKQNVRSFNNILNKKLLRSENNDNFIQEVVGDADLLKEICPELRKVLTELRYNIKCCSNRDFTEFLSINKNNQRDLIAVNKVDIFVNCLNIFNNLIPFKFFGCNHNYKIFKKCLQTIIYSMNRQYINFDDLIKRWDFTVLPWRSYATSTALKLIYNILKWLLQTILPAIITLNFFVTTCKFDGDENKLYFFWKSHWQAYYDKKISDMIFIKVLHRFESYCTRKKLRRLQNRDERVKLNIIKRNTPKLHLVLKPKDQYRPIVCYKNDCVNQKYKIKEKLQFLQLLNGKTHEKIENQYKHLYTNWINTNKPPLYFVRTDLTNAFGSIKKGKLLQVLHERYVKFEKSDISCYFCTKYFKIYKDLLSELKQPLLIRAGSTIYEWKKGLVQGYKYSPALSELYYTFYDKIYFEKHMNYEIDELKLFTRVVDDYLYITDSLEDAHLFLNALSNYQNVNHDKTIVNFPHETFKQSEEIFFLGCSYNTTNMQVSRAKTAYSGQVCFKIQLSAATSDVAKFLENRIGQSSININGHIFNFYYNNEELVWNHIFLTLCISANKFCCILAILCDEKDMQKYLPVYKKKVTVKLCNTIVKTLHRNKPSDIMFFYCINHLRYLSFKALLLCARHTPKCNVLVPFVSIELAKTNCIYGKWREHSSRILENGQSKKAALREVCRRSELRSIMKNFDSIPQGIQCFDQNIFYK